MINPLLVDGQVEGAIVQALGECFYEQVDGPVPAATRHGAAGTPSPFHPLGAKVGEGGSIGTAVAVANAVVDALAPLGIRHLDPPSTASRVWEAMRAENESRP